jgi:hypothetical protein
MKLIFITSTVRKGSPEEMGEADGGLGAGGAVKVAFVGKGGSGKTTLSSLFVRHLAGQGLPVVAIDADINQHLGEALGVSSEPPAMGARLAEIKEYLRGGNPRIASAAAMVVGVYRQWSEYADGYDVALAVVGNKVQHQPDADFLREHVGDGLLACFGHEPGLRAMEQGRPFDLADLGPGARPALQTLQDTVDAQVKDWATFTRQAVEFHLKNARAWANAAVGADLAAQVDPGFALSPAAPEAARA